jgi:hypothetical protein
MAARAGPRACPYTIIDEEGRLRAAFVFAGIAVFLRRCARKKPARAQRRLFVVCP